MKYKQLTPEEQRVLLHKGTERPFTGEYTDQDAAGLYVCKQCFSPLYQSTAKFQSDCGWPSFDSEIPGMVIHVPDADGRRTEIVCANCQGHLGHVFTGEGYTPLNTRHCVNSISMNFIPGDQVSQHIEMAVIAAGCYWGVEYLLLQEKGVIATTVGYAGGRVANPSYAQVCRGDTAHAEAVRVYFDPRELAYEDLVKYFFEIHDPTQGNRQGPDRGSQYRSAIFFTSPAQQVTAERVRQLLIDKNVEVTTSIEPLIAFYPERDLVHQRYYAKTGHTPYCHVHVPKF